MSADYDLAVFGTGGHGREIAWLAQRCHGADLRLCFVVDRVAANEVDGRPVLALDDFVQRHRATPTVVAVGDSALRRGVVERLQGRGLRCTGLVHPGVERSARVTLGEGVVIFAGAILTTNVRLGAHTHVNLGCTISHDADIGAYCTLSPGVHVAGHVRLGDGVFVGTGANIINGTPQQALEIGAGAVVGAGACVIRPVAAGARVVGVPARPC